MMDVISEIAIYALKINLYIEIQYHARKHTPERMNSHTRSHMCAHTLTHTPTHAYTHAHAHTHTQTICTRSELQLPVVIWHYIRTVDVIRLLSM